MEATPHTTDLHEVHGWLIQVEQLTDVLQSWRATGTKMGGYDWTTGLDKRAALGNFARKVGIPVDDVLKAFGL